MAGQEVHLDGGFMVMCLGCDWTSTDPAARHECPNDPKRLQAKLEQAERERDEGNDMLSEALDMLADANARMLIPICVHCGTKPGAAAKATHWRECPTHPARAALAAAESALAAAQGARDHLLSLVERWGIIHTRGNEESGVNEGRPYSRCRSCGVQAWDDKPLRHKKSCDVGAALAAESGKPGGEARGQAARDALAVLNARDEQWREALREGMEKIGSSAIMYAPKLYDLFTAAYRAELIASAGLPLAAESGSVVLGPHRHIEADECVPAYSTSAEPRAAPPALPAEPSGKGEQQVAVPIGLLRDLAVASLKWWGQAQTKYRDEGGIHWAGEMCAGQTYARASILLRKAEHAPPEHAEPGEAKKEEGA